MSAERFSALCLSVLFCATMALGQDRIQSAVDRSVSVEVRESAPAQISSSVDLGPVSPSRILNEMRLTIAPSAAQQAELDGLLLRQNDPQSPDYHRWLTPEEFGQRFGATDNELGTLRAWLESEGFHINRAARGHNSITFEGSAGQVESSFHTEIHSYRSGGTTHFANATAPRIPAAFADVVTGIGGLNDFGLHPGTTRTTAAEYSASPESESTPSLTPGPAYTASNGAHYLAPNDLANIYDITALYNAGYNGTGQKLAVMGQTEIALSDVRGFRSQFGLPASDPELVLAGANPGISAGDEVEADLDLEWAGAVARDATIVYVYSQSVSTSLIYAVDNDLAPVITMSYGGCETGTGTSFRAIAQQANAEGITWFNASGDTGAAGCDYGANIARNGPAVQFPANVPEVTAVGGTEFNETGSAGWNATNTVNWASAIGYIAEKGWNDTASAGTLEASGGGASTIYAKPWWQAGPGVPSDGARDVPDVSLSSSANHDGYLIFSNGSLQVVGGTSAATPSLAGIATLLNQYLVAKGLQAAPGLGNINPTLYNMAQSTTGVFHDITAGSNVVPCVSGTTRCTNGSFGYEAGAGYDMVTGLGSVDAYNLATKWNLSAGTGTTLTLAAASASMTPNGSTTLTATVFAISGTHPPTGSVSFLAGSVSIGSMSVTAAAAGAEGTAQITVKGASLLSGSNTITANYAPTGSFAPTTGSTTITVSTPAVATTMTLTAAPVSLLTSGTTTLTATMKAASGSTAPSGAVTFTAGNSSLGTATLIPSGTTSTATLAVKGSALAVGIDTIAASYAATVGFAASSGTLSVTVSQPPAPTATTLTVTATPNSITPSTTTVLLATVKASSGSAIPTGSVAFMLGAASLGSGTLGATGTAALTVKGSSLTGGSNSITVSYTASGNFAGSTGSATVTMSTPSSSTTLSASASSLSSTGTAQLTAVVTASSGPAPSGSVTFSAGSTPLGTITLTASGNSAVAIMVVPATKLAIGSNSITAAYSGSASLGPSTSKAITVVVTPAPVTTTTIAVASAATISATASTQITVTVRAASGAAIPMGTVTATLGATSLGTATLAANGTAAVTIAGSKLRTGANTISFAYSGATGFNPSTGALTVTVK